MGRCSRSSRPRTTRRRTPRVLRRSCPSRVDRRAVRDVFVDDAAATAPSCWRARLRKTRIKVVGSREFGKDVACRPARAQSGQAVIRSTVTCSTGRADPAVRREVARGNDMVLGVRSKRDERLLPPERVAHVLQDHALDDLGRDPAERGRLRLLDRKMSTSSTRCGAARFMKASSRAWLQGRLDRVPGERARERDALDVELLQALAVRARRSVLVLDGAAQDVDVLRHPRRARRFIYARSR